MSCCIGVCVCALLLGTVLLQNWTAHERRESRFRPELQGTPSIADDVCAKQVHLLRRGRPVGTASLHPTAHVVHVRPHKVVDLLALLRLEVQFVLLDKVPDVQHE